MGKRDFYDPYTMRVKEVDELIPELSKLIMAKLPGTPVIKAVWTVVCECSRTISFAKSVLDEPDIKMDRMMEYHGQIYVASTILRRVADELGVSNFATREVQPDGPDG